MDMVSVQTQRRIHEFEPQHVSNTLWACARMQLQEPLMLRAPRRACEQLSHVSQRMVFRNCQATELLFQTFSRPLSSYFLLFCGFHGAPS